MTVLTDLNELWKEYNYPSLTKFFQLIKVNKKKYTYDQIKDFIDNNTISQIHKRTFKKSKGFHHIQTYGPNVSWQMDLLDMQKYSKWNNGYKWILIVIDIFSRKAFAEALKDKTTERIEKALSKILGDSLKLPLVITSDKGGEFKGKVKKLLDYTDIYHRTAEIGDHHILGIVDRFSKTIKNIIAKVMTHNDNNEWINNLETIISKYNDTPHSSICNFTPNEAEIYDENIRECMNEKDEPKDKLKIGDFVRIKLKKNIFNKGYEQTYSNKTYEIVDKIGHTYTLDDGTEKREFDLQMVKQKENISKPKLEQNKKLMKFVRKQKKFAIETNSKIDDDGNLIPAIEPRRSKREHKKTVRLIEKK
jgi:hypothetical protein